MRNLFQNTVLRCTKRRWRFGDGVGD